MDLNTLKLKRLSEAKKVQVRLGTPTKRLMTDPQGRQIYVDSPGATKAKGKKKSRPTRGGAPAKPVVPSSPVDSTTVESVKTDDDDHLDEEKPRTPDFVRHCVTAITEKPESLARVEAGGSDGEKGSPFAICNASYKKKTRSKAAAHSQGKHHSIKQYKQSLKTLREDVERVRRQNANRPKVVFAEDVNTTASNRHLIRYVPRG